MSLDLSGMTDDSIDKFSGSGCWQKFFGDKTISNPTSYGNKPEGSIDFFSADNSDVKGCLIVNVDASDTNSKLVKFELTLQDSKTRHSLAFWGINNISKKSSTGFVKVIKKSDDGKYEDVGLKKDKFSTTTTDQKELLAPPSDYYKDKIGWKTDGSFTQGGWIWKRDCKEGTDRIGIFSSGWDRWSQKLFKKDGNSYWSTLFSGWKDKMGIWEQAKQK